MYVLSSPSTGTPSVFYLSQITNSNDSYTTDAQSVLNVLETNVWYLWKTSQVIKGNPKADTALVSDYGLDQEVSTFFSVKSQIMSIVSFMGLRPGGQ